MVRKFKLKNCSIRAESPVKYRPELALALESNMKYVFIVVTATCLGFSTPSLAQNGDSSANSQQKNQRSPIDILTETKGFDLNPYVSQVVEKGRSKWYKLIFDDAQFPQEKKGHVSIKFRVMKDGDVQNLSLDSNSGDANLDRAAYGSVAGSNPLPPRPTGFQCQHIDLRFNFYYNPAPSEARENKPDNQFMPCVTSKITSVKALGMSVSPNQVRIAVGTKQRFYATLLNAKDSAVNWSVVGAGCDRSACGVISPDGLYTAPANVPNPATISVTATVATSPGDSASSDVTIVEASDPH